VSADILQSAGIWWKERDESALDRAGLKTVVIQQQTDTMVIDFQERYANLFSDDPQNKISTTKH
jgi:hypothetical protein